MIAISEVLFQAQSSLPCASSGDGNHMDQVCTILPTSSELLLTEKYLIREFVNLAGPAMLPHTSGILTAVLPCLAYEDEERRMVS